MSPETLGQLSKVDRFRAQLTLDFKKSAFKLEKVLVKAFSIAELPALIVQMKESGAVIVGATALEFFSRREFFSRVRPTMDSEPRTERSGLELLVDRQTAEMVLRWLLSDEIGFKLAHFTHTNEHGTCITSGDPTVAFAKVRECAQPLRVCAVIAVQGICWTASFTRESSVTVTVFGTAAHPMDVILRLRSSKVLQLVTIRRSLTDHFPH